jgi:tetratricopeptide (TPR) repeat protein
VPEINKFALWLLILFLFTGCATGVSVKAPPAEMQEIENAFLAGKWDAVITQGKNLLDVEPDNGAVSFLMSLAYYMKGEYELQDEQRSRALKDEKSIDTVVAWCKDLVKRFPDNYYANLLLGSAYRYQDDLDNSKKAYGKAIEINPNIADAYLGLGAAYYEEDDVDDAITNIKKAVEINPLLIPAHFSLGLLYEFIGKIDEAIASYEKTVEIDPKYMEAYFSLGELYSKKGEKDKAVKAYEKVIELDPKGDFGNFAREAIKGIKEKPDDNTKGKP